jgi:hypothetical protein
LEYRPGAEGFTSGWLFPRACREKEADFPNPLISTPGRGQPTGRLDLLMLGRRGREHLRARVGDGYRVLKMGTRPPVGG